MKTFILDYSKWRSGCDSTNRTGRGHTLLLNGDGYMCCLGQFSLQVGKNKEQIKYKVGPAEVEGSVSYLKEGRGITLFAEKAIYINDDEDTSPTEKISLLRRLLGTKGIKLRVINRPK